MLFMTEVVYSQELSVRKERHNVIQNNENKHDKVIQNYPSAFGVELGYGINGHVPFNISFEHNRIYYGLTFNLSVDKGVKGKRYEKFNWDEFPEDHRSEGNYKQSFTVDLGYRIKHFVIGAGIGFLFDVDYRNCYDNFHILGNNGEYYKEKNSSGFDAKIFALYNFSMNKNCRTYLKAGYDITTSAFLCLGCQF